MFDPSPFGIPAPLAHADTSRDVLQRGGTSQWHPKWSQKCTFLSLRTSSPGESPRLVPNIGTALVQNTTRDFTQLKAALSNAFPAIQNRKDLETRF
ncbi:hypothetical protein TNCV_2837851 [Trichonephila clavipes]|nr:hypothetical protein TNCV_2837851 [Trichonephila clavipes]